MDRVAVVAVAQTKFEKSKVDQNYAEMVYEVVQSLFNSSGISYQDVDNIVTSSSDFWDGRTISDMAIQDAVGAWMKSESKVSSDGTLATLYAMMRILAGSFNTTLVVAHSKSSEGDQAAIENAIFDPIYQRQLGLDLTVVSAMQARAYMNRYPVTEVDLAAVVSKNLENATRNPFAQRAINLTIDQILAREMVCDPLRELDIAPPSDGAVAMLLAHESVVERFTDKPVWLTGVGHCQDHYYLGDRDLSTSLSLEKASEKAYKMAGITDPRKDFDLVELYDAFSYQELLWTEILGFAQKGQAAKLIHSGRSKLGGELPINPSGGVLSAHPMFVAGLARMAEATLQLRNEAGERQVEGAKRALVHATVGPCGQTHCVWVLSRN
ncbi:MAG: thiolase family protein [Blastocatellia bacterium]|nr:thiolase family protein [Blastocatellia bacterium]